MEALIVIQASLNSPKNQFNTFGKYKYRSCEDILAALKPLLKEQSALLTMSDDIVLIGERYYVRATATISCGGAKESVRAYARESEDKKGMDSSQVTGAASSYARKYALNGLFAIDDTKDADATETHGDPKSMSKSLPELTQANDKAWQRAIVKYKEDGNFSAIEKHMTISEKNKSLIMSIHEEIERVEVEKGLAWIDSHVQKKASDIDLDAGWNKYIIPVLKNFTPEHQNELTIAYLDTMACLKELTNGVK